MGPQKRLGMTARQTAAARYDQQNELCARIILADVERFGGPDSLMVIWARLVVEQMQPTIKGPLFTEKRAA
jgi:hypothetical protein